MLPKKGDANWGGLPPEMITMSAQMPLFDDAEVSPLALSRRAAITTGLGFSCLVRRNAFGAGTPSGSVSPASVVSQPARQWGAGAPPAYLPDPDVIALDPSFHDLTYFAAPIRRLWDQGGWLEGPAWSSEGRFLVLSDVIQSKALRYIWETGEITQFRPEGYAANGNCFDFDGRLVVCEDFSGGSCAGNTMAA